MALAANIVHMDLNDPIPSSAKRASASHDFEIAVEDAATEVGIGTALFDERTRIAIRRTEV
jgi:uncharacterized pyridoxal phosphate-containing UPF0001 family protein